MNNAILFQCRDLGRDWRRNSFLAVSCLLLIAGCGFTGENSKKPDAGAELMRKNANLIVDTGKNPREAVAIFDKIIAENPNDYAAYNGKAVAFDNAGNHFAAQELYKTALSLAPDSVAIKNNLAMSFILSNQPQQAIDLLKPLAENDPDNAIIRHNLATAYGISGQKEKAMELNLVDMTQEQAMENQRAYEATIERNKKTKKK